MKDCLNQASRGPLSILCIFIPEHPQMAPVIKTNPKKLLTLEEHLTSWSLSRSVHSLILCWDPIPGTPCESREVEELGLVGKLDRRRETWWAARKQWARRSSENIISRLIREEFKEKETLKQPRRLVRFGQLSWQHVHTTSWDHAHLMALRHV